LFVNTSIKDKAMSLTEIYRNGRGTAVGGSKRSRRRRPPRRPTLTPPPPSPPHAAANPPADAPVPADGEYEMKEDEVRIFFAMKTDGC
jgi:hypothetical protein